MAKKWNKALAFCMALCMCASTMNVSAWATKTTEIVDVPAKENGGIVEVEIKINENNDKLKVSGSENEDGYKVKVEGEFETDNGDLVNGEATYTAENKVHDYEADGGYEIKTENKAPEVEVDIPQEVGEKNSANSESSNEELEIPNAPEYDVTAESVEGGSVEVTTTKVEQTDVDPSYVPTVDENGNPIEKVEHFDNQVAADDKQDLREEIKSSVNSWEDYVFKPSEGNDYVYVGSENSSTYIPAIIFREAMDEATKLEAYGSDAYIGSSYTNYYVNQLPQEVKDSIAKNEDGTYKKDENGFLLDVNGDRIFKQELTVTAPDGKTTYYLHRFDAIAETLKTEGWYEDGEWKKEQNEGGKYGSIYALIHQQVLRDENGNEIITYSADADQPAHFGANYNMVNLEDAFGADNAAILNEIVANGYWGQKDDANTPEIEVGSLEAVKAMMKESGKFSDEEIAQLTDGMAMTATQCAIWAFTNQKQGIEFINMQYASKMGQTDKNGNIYSYPNMLDKTLGEDQVSDTALILKLYEHLAGLKPEEQKEVNSANTVITKENFLKDISLSVLEKAADHENNKDDREDNDAYVTELKFSLYVEPSEENKDDMIVKVVAGGKTYKCRLSGDDSNDGSDFVPVIYNSETKNYILSGITVTEGNVDFNITLEGIQNLQPGAYLYTSESANNKGVDSTTLVGYSAGGAHEVGVSMNLSFKLNVDDEVVVTERQWRDETYFEPDEYEEVEEDDQDNETKEIGDEQVPLSNLVDIFEENVPLASVPQTGANNTPWSLMVAAAGLALAVVLGKKNK